MSKRFLVFIIAAVLVFIGLVAINRDRAAEETKTDYASASNHISGEGNTGVTVIKYADFQCPACVSYYPIFVQLKEEFLGRVIFQFRHFPLIQIHQNAMAAHRASEAAGLQGKFWEMHDLLYENHATWSVSNNSSQLFEDYATQLQLDLERFKADVGSTRVNAAIQADIKVGQDIGVSGTPTFVVDGQLIESPTSIEAFRAIIDNAIQGRQVTTE